MLPGICVPRTSVRNFQPDAPGDPCCVDCLTFSVWGAQGHPAPLPSAAASGEGVPWCPARQKEGWQLASSVQITFVIWGPSWRVRSSLGLCFSERCFVGLFCSGSLLYV